MGTEVLERQVERTKTQDRVGAIIFALEGAAHPEGLTYKELQQVSSMPTFLKGMTELDKT